MTREERFPICVISNQIYERDTIDCRLIPLLEDNEKLYFKIKPAEKPYIGVCLRGRLGLINGCFMKIRPLEMVNGYFHTAVKEA